MRRIFYAILVGECLALLRPPGAAAALIILVATAVALIAADFAGLRRWRHPRLLVVLLLAGAGGWCWAASQVDGFLRARAALDAFPAGQQVAGVVTNFARRDGTRTKFTLHAEAPATVRSATVHVAVTWPGSDSRALPQPGDWCRLYVGMRRVHRPVNPLAPDAERALAGRRIGATAVVRNHPANGCWQIGDARTFARWRVYLSRAIHDAVDDRRAAAVIAALVVADRSGFTPADWARLQALGIGHLLAISGLHVALVSGGLFVLSRSTLALFSRQQAGRALRFAWYAAAAGAGLYAGLAGWGVPALRATIMAVLAVGCGLLRRRILAFDNLLLALAVLALADPLVLASGGLWLSFAAVAVLNVIAMLGTAKVTVLPRVLGTHVCLALALAPITQAAFGKVALLSPLVNLVAVPWTALLVVPLSLFGAVVSPLSTAAGALAWRTAGAAWSALSAILDLLPAALLARSFAPWVVVPEAMLLLPVLACAALPLPARRPALFALCVIALNGVDAPRGEDFRVTVLDVGQGLSVVVEAAGEALVYDPGPAWPLAGRDAGEFIVLPFLERHGIRTVRHIAVSHGDADHAGGLAAVRRRFPAAQVIAPGPQVRGVAAQSCTAARGWRYGAVRFRWLQGASPRGAGRGNNDSCVLLIESSYGRALLTGDIEREAEQRLLATAAAALHADLVVVPHHGSKTSSTGAFVQAVSPTVAIVSAGFRNAYGLPHDEVVARYTRAGARVYETARDGAVSVLFTADGMRVAAARAGRFGFWITP